MPRPYSFPTTLGKLGLKIRAVEAAGFGEFELEIAEDGTLILHAARRIPEHVRAKTHRDPRRVRP